MSANHNADTDAADIRRALAETPPAAADIVVVGSGPGGAVAAATLAEAGRETLILESGPAEIADSETAPNLPDFPAFGAKEMAEKYRAGGMTAVIARPPVNYAEAECLGGGSEINSGLYHRFSPETLSRWSREWRVRDFGEKEMAAIFAENERDIGVRFAPGPAQPASQILAAGADALGWSRAEIPRWFRYAPNYDPRAPKGERLGMTRTFLPRFARAGGKILPACEALKLESRGREWTVVARHHRRTIRIHAKNVFVAAGAIRTPALLRRSGFRNGVGNSLHLRVYARVVAEFAEEVNAPGAGIGPHQVDEFAPALQIGCAVSTAAHMAAALAQAGADDWLENHESHWRRRASYYVGVAVGDGKGGKIGIGSGGDGNGSRGSGDGFVGSGNGSGGDGSDFVGSGNGSGGNGSGWVGGGVRALPFSRGEAAYVRMGRDDFYLLSDGLRRLCRMLFAAGAVRILPVVEGAGAMCSPSDLWKLPRPLPAGRARLSSVHLSGTCPMGEVARAGADSFGRVGGRDDLRISDASLFCDSPGVNPQGGVMALSRRVARNFLGETGTGGETQ